MRKLVTLSMQTRINWLIDATVFMGALLASLTGVYFLFIPSGGYQGGRNPTYGLTILFQRQTWDDLHTWGGVLMIIAVAVHFSYHWSWVTMMARRMISSIKSTGAHMSKGARVNLLVDIVLACSFLVAALSGVYLLFAPAGGYQGGGNPGWDPNFLFARTTWDVVHTWSGVLMILSAVLHFVIHWRWIVNVTARFFQVPSGRPKLQERATLHSRNAGVD